MRKITRLGASSACALLTGLGAGWLAAPALAQEAQPAAQAPVDALTEIIVTANRRNEVLQDVPAAITAITGETLQRQNITNLAGIADRTPGLTFAAFAAGQPEIAIRGVGTKEDGPAASDSTVVSIDGVYIAARSAQVFDLFDLERVEVLRGPQGTLYGKNSIGGSINFVTLEPSATPVFRAQARIGNFGRKDAGGLVSGPLSDTVFAKAAVSYRSTDGYLRNVLVGGPHYGERWGETESFSYRSAIRWEPTDAFDVSLTVDGARDRNGATNREPVGSAGPLHNCGCASDPVAVNAAFGGASSPYTTLADVEGFTRRDIFGASLKFDYEFDFATLTAISSYRQTTYHYLEDSSGLPASSVFTDLTGASGNPNNVLLGPATQGFTFKITDGVDEAPKQYTQELRLTSPSGGRLDWITGLFYSRENNARTETFNFPSLGRADRRPSLSATHQTNRGTAWAVYGQASYALTDRLKLTGGARYSYEKKRITSDGIIYSGLPLLLQPYAKVGAEEGWGNVTWKAVAEYKLTEDAMAYASVATGFKSGGFTGSASTAISATTPFDPEKATSYEAGAKTELFDHRLRLNAAAFYTDYRDLQVTRFFQPAGSSFGQFITENAGKARIKGLEVEATARPTKGLELGGTVSLLDAKYVKFTGTPSQNNTGSFDGNRLRQAPKFSPSAFAGYTYDMQGGAALALRASWKHQSKSYYDADNNPITVIPAYSLLEGSLAYTAKDGHTTVSLWGKNLTDEAYRTHVFSQRDSRVAFALFGEPRTYGITIDYRR